MTISNWYSNSNYFEWQGHQIAFKKEESSKPWLLLIHGFPTASFDWWEVWEGLSKDFNLLAPDMIGFGYSDKPSDFPYSIFKQADLIEDLLRNQGITELHILAHDYGDTVAQELIARNLDTGEFSLNSVCLLNGGLFPETHQPILIQKLLMSPIGSLLSRMLNKRKFAKSFGSVFGPKTQLTDQEMTEYWKLVSHKEGHLNSHKLIRYMAERKKNRERWVSALQNCPCKLGLINGPEDPISGQHMVDRYKELIKEDAIWMLKRIGHYPQVEDPSGTLTAYREFNS